MKKLYINPDSKKLISVLSNNLPQSILLTGNSGVGLSTIAYSIADENNTKPFYILPEKDEKIDIEKGIISIETMRQLYENTRSKSQKKQIYIIDYADRMTHQAQNAFLKLLEEPNENTYFILVCHDTSRLLPTIISRVEQISIKNITAKQSEELLSDLKIVDKLKHDQLLFMTSGLPAEMLRLINDEEYFAKRSLVIRDARELIRGSQYDKLKVVQRYKDNREIVQQLLLDMIKILKSSISSKPQTEALIKLDSIIKALDQLNANCNIRLVLANLVV